MEGVSIQGPVYLRTAPKFTYFYCKCSKYFSCHPRTVGLESVEAEELKVAESVPPSLKCVNFKPGVYLEISKNSHGL